MRELVHDVEYHVIVHIAALIANTVTQICARLLHFVHSHVPDDVCSIDT